MAMNAKRVLLGGVVAGVVMNIIDFISNTYIVGERMKAAADAFKPGLGEVMTTQSPWIYIVFDIVLGILLVWTYAAVRPRFGAGAGTAVIVAALFWVLAGIFYSGYMMMGLMPKGLWWTFAIIGLVNFILSSVAGAWLYKEETVAV